MNRTFSRNWNRSKKPSKQRKYQKNAPLHIKQKFVSSSLSAELRKKYNKRSMQLKKGDKVFVRVGKFKGKSGKVDRVDVKRTRVYVAGLEIDKKEGSKALFPLHPSNVIITDVVIEDKKRKKIVERRKE